MLRKAITASVAAVAVIGGSTVALAAAATDGNPTFTACVTRSHTLAHIYAGSRSCPRGESGYDWNRRGPQGPAGKPGPAGSPSDIQAEVDNGAQFTVSPSPDLADTSAAGATYADAGIVVNAGTVGSLTSRSIAYTGSSSLLENIWIGDGPQASTPGTYSLSAGADFCYALGQDYAGGAPASFYMESDCGTYAGQTLTLAQIAKDFPAVLEAYAWVGITSSGSAVSAASIATVGGQKVDRTAGVLGNSDSTLTPYTS
jgi:hypothetical protein